MAEATLREISAPTVSTPRVSTPEVTGARIGEKAAETMKAAYALRDRLERQWEVLNARISNRTSAGLPGLKDELREDANYVTTRARYYHEIRPLSAVGMVAAAAFVVGAAIGLGRH